MITAVPGLEPATARNRAYPLQLSMFMLCSHPIGRTIWRTSETDMELDLNAVKRRHGRACPGYAWRAERSQAGTQFIKGLPLQYLALAGAESEGDFCSMIMRIAVPGHGAGVWPFRRRGGSLPGGGESGPLGNAIPGRARVARKWRRNGLKRLNPRPEMLRPRKPGAPKIWRPERGDRLVVGPSQPAAQRLSLGVAKLQKKAPNPLKNKRRSTMLQTASGPQCGHRVIPPHSGAGRRHAP